MDVKLFSQSDLGHLRGKAHDVVELVFVELRDVKAVALRLLITVDTVWSHIRHARNKLAGKGIRLPDRRFALPTGRVYSIAC